MNRTISLEKNTTNNKTNYEIRVMKSKFWSIHSIENSETKAIAMAEEIFTDSKVFSVEVIRNWNRNDGKIVERLVHKRTKNISFKKDDDVRISPIDTQNKPIEICKKPNDFKRPESRTTISRLFKKYIEKEIITPIEIMCNFTEIRKLKFKDNLILNAVHQIVKLRNKAGHKDDEETFNHLNTAIDQLVERAKNIEDVELPNVLEKTLEETQKEIENLGLDEDVDFLTLVSITRALATTRSWTGKLDIALNLKYDQNDLKALSYIDDIVSDILHSPHALKDLLGPASSLENAILMQLDLIQGKAEGNLNAQKDLLNTLNVLFKNKLLPQSKNIIIEHIERELKSPCSIQNGNTLTKIIEKMIDDTEIMENDSLLKAIIDRGARLSNAGGKNASLKGIKEILNYLHPNKKKLKFLLNVHKSESFADISEKLEDVAISTVLTLSDIETFSGYDLTPKEKMQSLTDAYNEIQKSNFSKEIKELISEKLDTAQESYLKNKKIIEKIDDTSLHIRKRAYMLVKFCASGVLINRKSAQLARNRVTNYLKNSHFVDYLVNDIKDQNRKENIIREFYKLLKQNGF